MKTLTRPYAQEFIRIFVSGQERARRNIWHAVQSRKTHPLCGIDIDKILAVKVAHDLPEPFCSRCYLLLYDVPHRYSNKIPEGLLP